MVVVYHIFIGVYGSFLPWHYWWRDFAHPPSAHFLYLYPLSFGWAGVALFFVLSGFCIHISYLKSTAFTWQRFFWQRFWRIYPAYLVALVFFILRLRIDTHTWVGTKQFGLHALLVHNLSDPYFFGINPSFWSLATEAQLYLLFPALIILRRKWGIEGCLVASFGVGLAWRAFAIAKWGLPELAITPAFSSPFMTWFDWVLGAFVAERITQQRQAFSKHSKWLLVLIPLFVMSTLYKPLTAFSFSLAAAISAVVLDFMLRIKWRKSLFLDVFVFIGTISYSLYLWHQPLLRSRLPGLHGLYRWVAILLAIFILSSLSWAFIENKGIRLGKLLLDRWTKSPRSLEGMKA
jgi:peptidoglycan/LPS O-acetylase OafA/YrhL